jgi:hypothetical protein
MLQGIVNYLSRRKMAILTGTDDVALTVELASTAKLVAAVVGTVASIDGIRGDQGGPGLDVAAGRVDFIASHG